MAVTAALLTGACSDNEVTTEPIVPAKLEVVGSSSVTAPAGMAVSPLLRVRLLTKGNQPVSRQVVHFTVSSGGILSADSSFTDEKGEATVGLTVGAVTASPYTVTATAEGVAPVTFTATATTPVPSLILAGPGNNQAGLATEALAPLQALVLKSDNSPAVGVTVNFQVASGGGSVNPTSAVTNANGIASTTFTLGTSGTQTVTASSGGIGSTIFTATIADPCSAARAYAIPSTISRTLDAADCKLANNRYVEYFDATVGTSPFLINESSTAFIPSMSIKTLAGDTVGFNTPGASPAQFKAFLAPGTYRIGASTSLANTTGAYTLTSTTIGATDSSVTNCERVYINRGSNSTGQKIQSTDCSGVYDDGSGSETHWFDRYRIYLKAGETITIRMEGTTDHLIRVINANTGAVVLQYDNGIRGATETTTFTAPTAGQWIIDAATYNNVRGTPETGTYKLTIT